MILAAAGTLLARARSTAAERTTPDSAEERLSRLEQSASESAQLLHDIAAQVHALTAVQDRTAKRAQVALVCAIAAVALAAAACVLVLRS